MSNVISFELKKFEKEVKQIYSDNQVYYYDNDNKPTLPLGLTNEELKLLSKCNNETITVLEEYQENNYDYESHLLYCEQIILYDKLKESLENKSTLSLNPDDFKWVVECIEFTKNENSIPSNITLTKAELKILDEMYENIMPKQNIILKTNRSNQLLTNIYNN